MKKSLFTNVSHFFLFLSFALSVTSPGMVNASDVTFSFEVVDKEESAKLKLIKIDYRKLTVRVKISP